MPRILIAAFLALSTLWAVPGWASQTITWSSLAPDTGPEVRIDPNAERVGSIVPDDFDGTEEDRKMFEEDIEFMRGMQPEGGRLNTSLDGQEVRIAGYITPVGFEETNVTEFLFVPFLGACSHVPPPEANQIIHVTDGQGVRVEDVWSPVWLTGTLRAKPLATVLADVGYQMEGATASPYDGSEPTLEGERSVDGD
ncbi:DUF3299 domain-containing protein [Rhizobiaceae bacterium]|nr:DUF3299 domain-containing protein [Rhizobiaceae bacterium]